MVDLGPGAVLEGGSPEVEIARDMARRSLPLAPVLILASGLIWGLDGALSSAYAIALVVINFVLAAAIMNWAIKISLHALMGAVLAGYVLRLALITVAVLAVKDQPWAELVPLGITLIVTHLGLLIWETRYVSASLAYPGLKPGVGVPAKE